MLARNKSIDILKIVLMIYVILVHLMPYKFDSEFQTTIATIFHAVARIVIPLFFIITGYFIKNKINDSNRIKENIFKFIKMFIIWQIIYGYLVYLLYKNNLIPNDQLLLSLFYGFGHLWYLNALFLGLILLYFTRNIKLNFKLYLAVGLIVIGYILQMLFELKYFSISQIFIYNLIGTSRNFLFLGFPYLLIGTIIQDLKIKKLKLGIFIFLTCIILEAFIYKTHNINISNLFISSIPLSIFVFKYLLSLNVESNFSLNPKLLLGTYLIHFYPVFYLTIYYPENTLVIVFLKILLVALITFIVFYFLNLIDKKIKLLF